MHHHARAGGDATLALRSYRSAVALAPPYVAAGEGLGDLLRETCDERAAREAFVGDYVDQQQLADWSWRDLRPAPRSALAIGDGLDFGYVGGVYLPEKQAGALVRWTNGNGALRLAAPGSGRGMLLLRLAAPRPDGSSASARVCVEGRCAPLDLGPEWRVYRVPIAANGRGSIEVEIRSDTFASPEGRRLGVLIDSAALAPAEEP